MVIKHLASPVVAPVDPVITAAGEHRNADVTFQATSAPLISADVMHKEKYELSISEQALRKSIEKANKAMEGMQRRFEYSIHEKTGDVVVKVINSETNEVVREIPNEKFLDLIAKLQELVGLNIDEKR
jgi:flagellar protein FlaG